jgi:hypothetical protein
MCGEENEREGGVLRQRLLYLALQLDCTGLWTALDWSIAVFRSRILHLNAKDFMVPVILALIGLVSSPYTCTYA